MMMYLLKCTMTDEEPVINESVSLKKIYELSKQQGIWPLVFLTVKKLYDDKKINMSPELMQNLQTQIVASVTKNAARKEILKIIISELEQDNVKMILLKGDSLADLYKYPDYRLSGDIDLYIREDDEGKIFSVFEKYGFSIERRMNKEHHSECRHPVAGTVELHVALYDDYCEEVWFEGKTQLTEEYTKHITNDGYCYDVLGMNDNFIYVTMHMIKHFLSGGAGLRQITDVLHFVKRYKSELDFERYKKLMCELSFDRFVDCCMEIGVRYLGFRKDELFYINESPDEESIEGILSDLEKCGLFGHNDNDLREFKMVYLEKKYKSLSGGELNEYMSKRLNIKQKFGLIFLKGDAIKRKYTYLEKYPFLLPIAWVHRIINYVFRKKDDVNHEVSYQKETTFDTRMELLKKLKIL